MIERRTYSMRTDINNLFRSRDGQLSGSKIGTYVGQYIAAQLLLTHSTEVINRWDSMMVLFLVLIAPEAYKQVLAMKFGGQVSGTTERTERTERTTKEITK